MGSLSFFPRDYQLLMADGFTTACGLCDATTERSDLPANALASQPNIIMKAASAEWCPDADGTFAVGG